MALKAIILAAGKGTRMKSDLLKVLHHVAGKPILNHVLDTVLSLNIEEVFMVVGHQADQVRANITHPNVTFVKQEAQLGTGHAVMQVQPYLPRPEDQVIILAGDCPLIEDETLRDLLAIHSESNASATILTAHMHDPGTYGRIIRGQMGTVLGIKEAKDCDVIEKKITEINTGVYAFEVGSLFESLSCITPENTQNEYYLTDVIRVLKERGQTVDAYCTDNVDQVIGINTRMDLAKINTIVHEKTNLHWMQEGVTIIDPATTFIDSTVRIGPDTIIHPFSLLQGSTVIEARCHIGPHAFLKNAHLKEGDRIAPFTVVEES